MQIWVDADACPGEVKEIIIKAAQRLKIKAIFVANKGVRLIPSPYLAAVLVGAEFDAADAYIAEHAALGDVAITADIPLAGLLVPKGVAVIDPRGELFTPENIAERVSIRNLMHEMRSAGSVMGGPSGYNAKDKQRFASTFDAALGRAQAKR